MTDLRERLRGIRTFASLVKFLREELEWPIDSTADFEDLTFDYTPEELGIDPTAAAKIESIQRLRPLSTNQPWGIFFVQFEPKTLPVVALRRLLSRVALKKRASANSAERAAWAADDLLFISNYGEAEERQITFAHFSPSDSKRELPTLKVLGWDNLDTPLHLDNVAENLTAHLAWPTDERDIERWRQSWRSAFTLRYRQAITTSRDLSVRLAELARAIRDRIRAGLAIETSAGPLTKLMGGFRQALIHDLDPNGFADMYAQTIAYGLLSARIASPESMSADGLSASMPVTNPFVKELMETFLHVGSRRHAAGGAGIDFDELGVGEIVELLDNTNMTAVLQDFGDQNPEEDPVIHFYEHFLEAYDRKQKVHRGVFYTPRPVVSYIVRAVDTLLRTEFRLEDGLADTATWADMTRRHPMLNIPVGVDPAQPFVQILDPATGTGTFLVEIVDVIYQRLRTKWQAERYGEREIAKRWNDYVRHHLLPRLHGYEIQMAPYAIAHLKLGLKLLETGYKFDGDERARIYLTNAVEPARDFSGQFDFATPALAHEAQQVNAIKAERRFTVVLGNPPYSNFGQLNRIPFILDQLKDYKRGLNERKLNLDDDFIKFIRLGQWLLEGTGVGVFGLISNSTYIDGITHREMRRSLISFANTLYILDLHGSHLKPVVGAHGEKDENVFDIRQGVAVGLFAHRPGDGHNGIYYFDLRGSRHAKYAFLLNHGLADTPWQPCATGPPTYFLIPTDLDGREEYRAFEALPSLMPCGTSAIQTKRDALFVDFDDDALAERMADVLTHGPTTAMRERYPLEASAGWSPERLRGVDFDPANIRPYLYRPFDRRFIYYDDRILGRSRITVFHNLLHQNLALATLRQTVDDEYRHVFCTDCLCDINLTIGHHVSDRVFPLYLYPNDGVRLDGSGRTANFDSATIGAVSGQLGFDWLADGKGDLVATVGPEDLFDYVYGILYAPSYRSRYKEYLRIDSPRLPLPTNTDLFRDVVRLGGELVGLHLMTSPVLNGSTLLYRGPANPAVGRVTWADDTVWLNAPTSKKSAIGGRESGSFRSVTDQQWRFRVGGYQVCQKWLKDRKGRSLSEDDISHYGRILTALDETQRVMKEIDQKIGDHGGWPTAFAVPT